MRRVLLIACSASSGAVVAASLIPWVRFGETQRSGFALAVIARQAGVLEGAGQQVIVLLWLMIPLAASLGFAGSVFGRMWLATAGAVYCGAVGLIAALGVLQSSSIGAEFGVWAGAVSSACALASAALAVAVRLGGVRAR